MRFTVLSRSPRSTLSVKLFSFSKVQPVRLDFYRYSFPLEPFRWCLSRLLLLVLLIWWFFVFHSFARIVSFTLYLLLVFTLSGNNHRIYCSREWRVQVDTSWGHRWRSYGVNTMYMRCIVWFSSVSVGCQQ
jgi:hypothetical protein